MSWLDKLPKELKLLISIQNFDVLAWFMITDSTIYTHYTEHKKIFYELFLEHEACAELIIPLFEKLHETDFMREIPSTTYYHYDPSLIKQKNTGKYIISYDRVDWRTGDVVLHKYTISDGLQLWTMYYEFSQVPHRDNASDGRPLAAIISKDGKKDYFNCGKLFYPQI